MLASSFETRKRVHSSSTADQERPTVGGGASPPPWMRLRVSDGDVKRDAMGSSSIPAIAALKNPLDLSVETGDRNQKRLRASSLCSPVRSSLLTHSAYDVPMSLLPAGALSPEEQRLESSQTLMQALKISQQDTQQDTQECTQTVEDKSFLCIIRLVLHPEVERTLTASQKYELQKCGLHVIPMHTMSSEVTLGRDAYSKIFDKHTSRIDSTMLSRKHCTLECLDSPETSQRHVYLTDKSMNGVRIDGVQLVKGKKYQLSHGQIITLLNSKQGNILLGYVVEDPHVRSAQMTVASAVPESQESSQRGRDFQELTLGVLFSSPLVGKDAQGKYHPIADLDVKREYLILQQSLLEASKYAKRPAVKAVYEKNGFGFATIDPPTARMYQYPRQINICAKFANTENFRMLATIGCRALHFSGHGDEQHLYFEDGLGLVHPIPHNHLQELFSAGMTQSDSPLRLAFVSACSSAPLAHAFVACGIPHVIGVRTNQKIEDYAAIEFTRSFYLALATGKSVAASFAIAQQAVAKSPNIRGPMEVADKFLLLPEDGDHSEIVFPLAAVEANRTREVGTLKLKQYPKLWFDDLPALCQGFCNRSVEVYKISLALMLVQSRITRLVTICGQAGIGKTAVAHAVAHYVGPRITSEGCVRIFAVKKFVDDEFEDLSEALNRDSAMAKGKCRVLKQVMVAVRDHLTRQKAHAEFQGKQQLLVIDGCDYLLRNENTRARFRAFLSDILADNALLKVVLTARTCISSDGVVSGHGERMYTLPPFTAKMSVKMLLSLVSRPIRLEELTRSTHTDSTDKLELIAAHPALLATQGIPDQIAALAGKLNHSLMDSLSPDK